MTFPTRLQDLLEEGRVVIRGMVKFQLGSGFHGMWLGNYDLVYDDGAGPITYRPNQLLSAEPPEGSLGMEATEFVVSMPAATDFGVTPDILALIEQEDYKGRPCWIYEAYIDPDTRELLYVEQEMAFGYVDFIDHVQSGGELRLEGHVISGAVDNHRDGYRSASNEDQQLISAGDLGFQYATSIKTEKFDITF
ncbi:hypothetical protein LB566_03210 [Mesorhizobium sp. CA13]|uniref:hypothetical protein n=1 Tax=Mesorhizobium sp. CA13 TaxID=2876643 RepID=UPI001CCE9401|nr:hypothetical protein [Mesorhizobium sp. CA13]MBZ9852791.1 hypothetical protein [Mesorhizobium sp. CA13]